MNDYKLYQGDCLRVLKELDTDSVDLILQDPPYNSTSCEWEWDILTKIDELWGEWFRILKPDGNIVMTGSEPFSSKLRLSNLDKYRYDWVWDKVKPGNIFNAETQPMKRHENVMVFSKSGAKFNPQLVKRDKIKRSKNYGVGKAFGGEGEKEHKMYRYTHRNPTTVLTFSNANQTGKLHPTQKPVELMEYLIKTYSDPCDVVLDGFIGSGTTMEASQNLRRDCIGVELLPEYCEITKKRCFTRTFLDRQVEYKFMIVDGEQ